MNKELITLLLNYFIVKVSKKEPIFGSFLSVWSFLFINKRFFVALGKKSHCL